MTVIESFNFKDCDAITAAGAPLRVPAGVYQVERRSLVFRVRLGGREVDLTLAEWERLRQAGSVESPPGEAPASQGTGTVHQG